MEKREEKGMDKSEYKKKHPKKNLTFKTIVFFTCTRELKKGIMINKLGKQEARERRRWNNESDSYLKKGAKNQ